MANTDVHILRNDFGYTAEPSKVSVLKGDLVDFMKEHDADKLTLSRDAAAVFCPADSLDNSTRAGTLATFRVLESGAYYIYFKKPDDPSNSGIEVEVEPALDDPYPGPVGGGGEN